MDLDGAFAASVAAAVGDYEMVDKEMVEKMVEVVHPHYYLFDS